MNHLCTGHVYLIAAQRISEKPRDKRFYAPKAVGEFQYTIRHMAPACPLKTEIEGPLASGAPLRQASVHMAHSVIWPRVGTQNQI